MDLIKQYLTQSLTAASNNLRLTTHQLEALGLLRECILNSTDLGRDIARMKTITALSTLGIRLNEIYSFLSKEKIDFFRLSEKFKLHSQHLINDLNQLLEIDNPEVIRVSIKKINALPVQIEKNITENQNIVSDNGSNNKNGNHTKNEISKDLSNKQEGIFSDYESAILKPIKPIDSMLKKLAKDEFNIEELSGFARLMKTNSEISEKNGFEILSQMHKILHKAFLLLKSREMFPGKEIIESIRACLIVIVAVVKGKDVDITNYLKKAEDFDKEINAGKIRV